jgi:histidinol-phosphate aminotransferase
MKGIVDLSSLVRENIRRLKPYSSARSEFAGSAEVFLDANENAFGSPAGNAYNRYPDPLQMELKARVAEMNGVDLSQIFVGNGSDEAIDLLFRIFCEPGRDECIVCPPTYGMYQVSADINDVSVKDVPLTPDFQLDVDAILRSVAASTKLIFVCSPNNPTGNLMRRADVVRIAENVNGIVVIDEAYIHFSTGTRQIPQAEPPALAGGKDFTADRGDLASDVLPPAHAASESAAESFISELSRLPNIVILQTFSKAWAMAGLRVGIAFASEQIIDLLNRVKPPYNVSGIAQRAVLDALDKQAEIDAWIAATIGERTRLNDALAEFEFVQKVHPTDANFLLVATTNANAIYQHLVDERIVVRNRNNIALCEGCLRITVGTTAENDRLLRSLGKYKG